MSEEMNLSVSQTNVLILNISEENTVYFLY